VKAIPEGATGDQGIQHAFSRTFETTPISIGTAENSDRGGGDDADAED
jgi:hypothetical protein